VFSETAEPMYFLHPNHIGKGAGSAIMNRLETYATEKGIRKFVVEISTDNTLSIAFHKKHGFTECGTLNRVGKKFGQYFSITFMEKDV